MHGEIPDDADVVLEQPEIHTDRVVIVHLSETAFDDLAHLPDGAGVHESMIHRENKPATRGFVDQPLCLVRGRRHRLLDENVLSRHQRFQSETKMGRNGSGDGDGVNARIAQDLIEVVGDLDGWIAVLHGDQTVFPEVANLDEARALRFGKVSDEVRTPVAVAHHSNADHLILPDARTLDEPTSTGASLARPTILAGTPATIA